jgi:hypothetical protein
MRFVESDVMGEQDNHNTPPPLPPCATEYIALVVRKVRYRKKVRRDIAAELTAHFEDELQSCMTAEERETKARQVIEGFGDPQLLAVLCRRAKKRCRPLWRKALSRSVQLCGAYLLYLMLCTLLLFSGRPTIRRDYVQSFNETVAAGRLESDNAWPCFDKAAKLQVAMPGWLVSKGIAWPPDLTEEQWKELSRWLDQNAPVLDALREGVERKCYWREYLVDMRKTRPDPNGWWWDDTQGLLLEETNRIHESRRQLFFTMRWQICYEAHQGRVDAAMDECLVMARFGDRLVGVGSSSEQSMGMFTTMMANDLALRVLDRADGRAVSLARIQQEWGQWLDRNIPAVSFDWEKALGRDTIQHIFTDNGRGNGHLLLRQWPGWLDLPENLHDFLKEGNDKVFWAMAAFRPPSRRRVVSEMDRYYSQAERLYTSTPWELYSAGLNRDNWIESPWVETLLSTDRSLGWGTAISDWGQRTYRVAVGTVLSVQRHQMERGRYPDDLQQLVDAGYLREIPRDPFAPGPLTYKRVEDSFVLYSWGENCRDDGGQRIADSHGRDLVLSNNGDWVFWPIIREKK